MNNGLDTGQVLKGKVALVTGGAGGIGTAICRHLADAGATVVVTYNSNGGRAEALVDELRGDGHLAVQMQVDDSESIYGVAAQVMDGFDRLDILVNNAGTTRFVLHDDLDDLDDEVIDRIFRVNLRGAFACTRAFKSLLSTHGDGLVVNISSIAGLIAYGSNVAYCASKAALDNMTVSLARALAPDIRVLAIAPGLVDGDYARSFDPAWRQAQIDMTPLQRLTQPDDVARSVMAVATMLTHSTGVIIPVDGGRIIV
jgi:3-oxoacyl-[acyl-carrier protein] reductase